MGYHEDVGLWGGPSNLAGHQTVVSHLWTGRPLLMVQTGTGHDVGREVEYMQVNRGRRHI